MCEHLLVRSSSVLVPIGYLMFETLPCLLQANKGSCKAEHGEDNCLNATVAFLSISGYLVCGMMLSFASYAVPSSVARSESITYEALASLRLTMKQKTQSFLIFVTGICGLYVFAFVGKMRSRIDMVWMVGAVGAVSILTAVIIEFVSLNKATRLLKEGVRPKKMRFIEERVSAGHLEEGMIMAAMM